MKNDSSGSNERARNSPTLSTHILLSRVYLAPRVLGVWRTKEQLFRAHAFGWMIMVSANQIITFGVHKVT